jgi:hypothetical protein
VRGGTQRQRYMYVCMYVCIYIYIYIYIYTYIGGSERRNAASAGWGSWDIWEQRRILFMKKVLAEEGVEALKSDLHRCSMSLNTAVREP